MPDHPPPALENPQVAQTGIEGLDHILGGGLPRDRLYLLEGAPGAGKTTLALQFLLEGQRLGEPGLYVTLSETEAELRGVCRSHGWSLDRISVFEMDRASLAKPTEQDYTVFHPAEVELGETTQAIFDRVDATRPVRVVVDSLSELRLLARDPLRYRRQILALKQFFVGQACTVLLLDDLTAGAEDLQLQSLANGVIRLEQLAPEYGAERRRLRVVKVRGVKFRGGFHDFIISRGGLEVFPRLVAAEHRHFPAPQVVTSGLPEFDRLLGGGLERGTSALLLGPAGTGKSAIATQYALSFAALGERAVVYLFDEGLGTFRQRAGSLGHHLDDPIRRGRLRLQQIDPAEISPGHFGNLVKTEVEREGASLVVIDSLNGYLNAMPEERFLIAQLHELFAYLRQQLVLAISVVSQAGLLNEPRNPIDLSYLADTVLLTRYFEAEGSARQAISVVKRRSGWHERTLRELRLEKGRIWIGDPLPRASGILDSRRVSADAEPSPREG